MVLKRGFELVDLSFFPFLGKNVHTCNVKIRFIYIYIACITLQQRMREHEYYLRDNVKMIFAGVGKTPPTICSTKLKSSEVSHLLIE